MRGRQARAWILGFFAVFMDVPAVHAQQALPGEAGFQPNRDYLSLLPWESVDTGSNNVILTFTDLVLPANGGRELRFDRVFSNQVSADPGGPQWRFGIAGVPMRVIERSYPQRALPPGNIQAERDTTPYFWMLDGSRLETTYVQTPNHTKPSTLVTVRTPSFWTYDRTARTLRLPDGTFADYDADGYLVRIRDAFHAGNTNIVTLAWDHDLRTLDVEQLLGNGESRIVHIVLDGEMLLPVSLSYSNRTWTYDYPVPGRLAEVVQPGRSSGGANWRYEYAAGQFDTGKVMRVTTPQGGVIEYEYEDFSFYQPGSGSVKQYNALAARRMFDRGTLVGEWTFDHLTGSQELIDQTDVTLPSGAMVTFVYGAASDPNVLAGAWVLRFRNVQEPDGTIVEREEREYSGAQLLAARAGVPWYVPRLTRRTIIRAGQAYTTDYAYSATTSNFHNYHRPTTITERGPSGSVERTTALTYVHLLTPNRLALPRTETTTLAGMTATRAWVYNSTTGFRERETVYGITTTYVPDAFGNVATVRKGNGTTTSFTYSWGVLQNTNTPGVVVQRTINSDGTVASESVGSRTTTYAYDDPLGRRTKTQPPGDANPIVAEYDDGNRTVTTRRGNSMMRATSDGFGRPVETANAVGVRIRTEYDGEGRKRYQSYPFTNTDIGTSFDYDALGRLTRETNPDGTSRTRDHDDATQSVTIRDEEGRATVLTFHGFGHPDDARLVRVVDAHQQEWRYSYDAIGNLVQVVAPTGHARTWLRNSSGQVTSETHPESGTVLYTMYDGAGILKRKIDARGTEFVYQHDGNNRLTRIKAGTRITNIVYEPGSDNRASMSNGSVSTSFAYDAAGRLSHRRDVVGTRVFDSRYTYDGNDRIATIAYPSGRLIGYERADAEGRITRVFENAAGRDYAFGMNYHPSGALAAYTAGNKIATTVTHDPARYRVHRVSAGPLQLTYDSYDGVGNVLSQGDSRPGMGQAFAYDALDRLTSASGPYGSAGYAYDAHGNRQSASGSTYLIDPDTLRLSAQNGVPFGYDSNGNLTSTPAATYAYTPENWLASVTVSGGKVTYLYDADGWRIQKSTAGETTLYLRGLSGELLTEWRDTGSAVRARDYVYSDKRLLSAVERPVGPSTICGDGIPDGSPVTVTIPSGGIGTVTFEGSACRRVAAVITASTVGNCSNSNSFSIRSSDGSTMANSNNLCEGAIVGPVTLPVTGTYSIVMDPFVTTVGQVTVRVYDIVDVTGSMTLGHAVNTSLTVPGQQGRWTFVGSANQRVSAVINTSTFPNCVHFNWFAILRPDGTTLGGGQNVCGGTIIGPFVLPTNGVYTVVVDPTWSYTGQMSVTAYNVVDVTGPVTVNGSAVIGALTTPGQRALWSFGGMAGQRVRATLNASTVPNCVTFNNFSLLQPSGASLGGSQNICGNAMIGPFVLPSSGTYTVLVDPASSATGTVTMRVFDPGILVNEVAPPAVVTVPPGTSVSVRVVGGSGNSGDWVALAVAGSSHSSYLAYQYVPTSGAAMSFKMPVTPGTYEFRLFPTSISPPLMAVASVVVQ